MRINGICLRLLLSTSALAYGQIICQDAFAQSQVLSYPSYQRYQGDFAEPTDMVKDNNYYQAQPPAYHYQSLPKQTYPTYQNNNQVPAYQPQPQVYKRAPRMHYHDTGHRSNQLQNMFSNVSQARQPRHYQSNNSTQMRTSPFKQMNRTTMKQNLLRVFLGGGAQGGSGGGGYGANRDPSAIGRASSQRSYALSQADAAEACASRARYGPKDSRKDAAYEARSHANIARAAAEKAQAAASQGGDEARGYASDAWAAANRAESAASRAASFANVW